MLPPDDELRCQARSSEICGCLCRWIVRPLIRLAGATCAHGKLSRSRAPKPSTKDFANPMDGVVCWLIGATFLFVWGLVAQWFKGLRAPWEEGGRGDQSGLREGDQVFQSDGIFLAATMELCSLFCVRRC